MGNRVTIYDIAKKLGLSTATVNRALTGKSTVNESTRQKVVAAANEMGFKPNSIARSLASRKLHLAVVGFSSFPTFHNAFIDGAKAAADDLQDFNVKADFFSYEDGPSNTPEADAYLTSTLDYILHEDYDGVLALARQSPLFARLKTAGKTVFSAVNDLGDNFRDFHISYNGLIGGRMAAEMIYLLRGGRCSAAIASGWEDLNIHNSTVNGFKTQLQFTPLDLVSVYFNHDNPEMAYDNTIRLLRNHPQLSAIYVNSFNSEGVICAIRDMNLSGSVLLITSDISDCIREAIISGEVAASIYQNQQEQGNRGFRMLYQCLSAGEKPQHPVVISPELIISSNVDLY